jgi:hypothetical protein
VKAETEPVKMQQEIQPEEPPASTDERPSRISRPVMRLIAFLKQRSDT